MYTFKYILKRLGLALMTFSIIFTMYFVLIKLLPIDTSTVPIGQDTQKLEILMEQRGYNKPILEQYFLYLSRMFKGDFGVCINIPSYRYKPVMDLFVEKLPPTILLNIYSSLLAVPVGISLGIFAALKKNKWQDHFISTAIMVVISVPSFVYAAVLLYILCFKLQLFPLTMKAGYDYFTWDMFKSMLPAVFSLSFGSIAGYARSTRAELCEVLTSEYMLLARTKGLTKAQATTRHALRNAMVPIFPSIVAEFLSVMSGSLIIEKVFSIPGVGDLYLSAINAPDYDLFMMLAGFYLVLGLVGSIVVDLSYGIIDPRIRMGAR